MLIHLILFTRLQRFEPRTQIYSKTNRIPWLAEYDEIWPHSLRNSNYSKSDVIISTHVRWQKKSLRLTMMRSSVQGPPERRQSSERNRQRSDLAADDTTAPKLRRLRHRCLHSDASRLLAGIGIREPVTLYLQRDSVTRHVQVCKICRRCFESELTADATNNGTDDVGIQREETGHTPAVNADSHQKIITKNITNQTDSISYQC
jgi:hypothetical protein